MPTAELMRLAQEGDLEKFEARCLEHIESGQVQLADLARPFERLAESGADATRLASLGQMLLESAGTANAAAALPIARATLSIDPNNAAMRERVIELYRAAYANTPGFENLLSHSGLTAGRPARSALRVLEFCLSLRPGEVLISRTEDAIAEVKGVDHASGLYTLLRDGRMSAVPALEMARDFERIDPDDFRVLRELRPERLAKLIEEDPVALVIGLIHAHGQWIDQDTLKAELVPKYISSSAWSKWWTRARTALKRCQNVIMEGRSPVILRYAAEGQSAEQETWEQFAGLNDVTKQLAVVAAYVRDKRGRKEEPDAELIERCRQAMLAEATKARSRRPIAALTAALCVASLDELCGQADSQGAALAAEIMQAVHDPADLFKSLPDATTWQRGVVILQSSRPQDAAARLVELIPIAPVDLLDTLCAIGIGSGLREAVQEHVDTALADPVDYPEIVYWLWKGPAESLDLRWPDESELFAVILDTLAALGRSLNPPAATMKHFRQRMRAALALKDYARAGRCIERIEAARAITVRQQLTRVEGLGENAPARLLDMLRSRHPTMWQSTQRPFQPWEDPAILWTTRAGLQRKTEERDHLVNVTMRENAKRIGEAAALGDLSENSEYKFALEERDLLRARLAQMNRDLSMARAIDPQDVPTTHVGVGSKVRLRNIADGSERVMTLLGPFDGDLERGIFNYKAPVCQNLLGLKVGERTVISVDGADVELEVVEITSGVAAGGG